jgi:hypothetical protein
MSELELSESMQETAGGTAVEPSRFSEYVASGDTGRSSYKPMSGAKYDTSKPAGGVAQVPKMDTSIYPESKKPTLLKGHAEKADPDAGNEEVLIGWNKWAQDVQLQSKKNLGEFINHPSRLTINDEPVTQEEMLDGIEQQNRFSVKFDRNGHVAQIKKVQGSGNPIFDKVSETAITDLDGTSTVRFPAGSRRTQSEALEFGFRPGTGRDDLRKMGAERVTRARNYYESEDVDEY